MHRIKEAGHDIKSSLYLVTLRRNMLCSIRYVLVPAHKIVNMCTYAFAEHTKGSERHSGREKRRLFRSQ